jgi:hypothetical protein
MEVIPFGSNDPLIGEPGLDEVPEDEMVLLAFAAPVFAESSIFLKNPLFLGFKGVARPPRTLAVEPASFIHSGCCTVPGVSGTES